MIAQTHQIDLAYSDRKTLAFQSEFLIRHRFIAVETSGCCRSPLRLPQLLSRLHPPDAPLGRGSNYADQVAVPFRYNVLKGRKDSDDDAAPR
jgi:hypothetical protein